MAEQTAPGYGSAGQVQEKSSWAMGFILFAGIILAVLSLLANFAFIPYYPFWSLTIIAVDIFVIWALVAHGRDVTA